MMLGLESIPSYRQQYRYGRWKPEGQQAAGSTTQDTHHERSKRARAQPYSLGPGLGESSGKNG